MLIPWKSLKEFTDKYDITHAILFAFDGKEQYVVTCGDSILQCKQAADFGNQMKSFLGWPASLHTESTSVLNLQKELSDLKEELKRTHIRIGILENYATES